MVIVKRDHAKRKVYTEEQKELMIANASTWRLIDFAKKFNVSHSVVYKWKVELGLNGTRVRVKKEKQEEQDYHFNWKIAKKHDFIFRSDNVKNNI